MVDRGDGLDRLNLNYDKVFCQQIHAVTEFELYSKVDDRKAHLRGGTHSSPREFELQTSRVRAFQQPGTQLGMYFHGSGDNRVADLLSGELPDRNGGHGYLRPERYRNIG